VTIATCHLAGWTDNGADVTTAFQPFHKHLISERAIRRFSGVLIQQFTPAASKGCLERLNPLAFSTDAK
jgi:hypothetical protein